MRGDVERDKGGHHSPSIPHIGQPPHSQCQIYPPNAAAAPGSPDAVRHAETMAAVRRAHAAIISGIDGFHWRKPPAPTSAPAATMDAIAAACDSVSARLHHVVTSSATAGPAPTMLAQAAIAHAGEEVKAHLHHVEATGTTSADASSATMRALAAIAGGVHLHTASGAGGAGDAAAAAAAPAPAPAAAAATPSPAK